MLFGLIVDPQNLESVACAARSAEAHGFSSFWLPDSPSLFLEVYVGLTAAARSAKRIRLGPCVTNPVTRHLSDTVDLILMLDGLCQNRAILGLGRGDSAVRLVGANPASLRDLENAVDILRRLMKSKRPHRSPVSIFLAASGPRTLRLAGRLADGAIVTYGVTPQLVTEARNFVELGLRSAGRKWDDFRFALNVNCALGDGDRALSPILPSVAAKVNYALAGTSLPASRMGAVQQLREAYNYEQHQASGGRQTAHVQPWMVERFAVFGAARVCGERFRTLGDAGVDEIIVDPGHAGVDEFVTRFARGVLPLVS